MSVKQHILVTGPHRSGTTWIGKTIARHADVEYIHEPFNPDFEGYNFNYKFSHWFECVPFSEDRETIEKVFDQYLPTRRFEYPAKICRETGLGLKTPLIYLKYLLRSSKMPHYLLKDPIALLSAGWLYERYQLKVICVTRNPLAFAGSLKALNWDFDFNNFLKQKTLMEATLPDFYEEIELVNREGDFIDRIALLWNVLNFVILEYRKKYPSWFFITHKTLAQNPVPEFEKIFDYLGLEFSEPVVKYIRNYTSPGNPKEADGHQFQPRDSKKTLHTWKNRLTKTETQRIIESTEEIYSKLFDNLLPLEKA